MQRSDLPNPLRSLRAAGRFTDVLTVLFKYGFGSMVHSSGLPGKKLVGRITRVDPSIPRSRRIRMALEELGPTFVKIGQVLSLRPDLIPLELAQELRSLQEDVRREAPGAMARVVEESLGKPLHDCFRYFDPEPAATGSLAQVHRATLPGTDRTVAVKIRRPGIKQTVEADLELLRHLAALIHDKVETLKDFDLPAVVEEAGRTLRRELDFQAEARTMALVTENFRDEPRVHVPEVLEEWTTERVLTMEYVDGLRLDEITTDDGQRHELARLGLEAAMRQIMVDGLFHADPHPGNLIIRDGDTLCFIDWGMIGRLTKRMRGVLIDFFMAVVEQSSGRLLRALKEMSVSRKPLMDEAGLERDLLFVLDKMHHPLGGNGLVSTPVMEMVDVCRTRGLRLRPDFVYMFRALIASEATGRQLSPDFDIIAELRPMAARHFARRTLNAFSGSHLLEMFEDGARLVRQFPARANRLIGMLEAGTLGIEFRHHNLESLQETIGEFGKRIATALITASLVIGSSLIVAADIGPHWAGVPVLGLIGYVMSAVFGAWLILHMLLRKF